MGVLANGQEVGRFRARIPSGASSIALPSGKEGSNQCTSIRLGADPGATKSSDPGSIDDTTIVLLSNGTDIGAVVCSGSTETEEMWGF